MDTDALQSARLFLTLGPHAAIRVEAASIPLRSRDIEGIAIGRLIIIVAGIDPAPAYPLEFSGILDAFAPDLTVRIELARIRRHCKSQQR